MPIYVPFLVLAAISIAFGWTLDIPIKTNIKILLACCLATTLFVSILTFGIAPLF